MKVNASFSAQHGIQIASADKIKNSPDYGGSETSRDHQRRRLIVVVRDAIRQSNK